MKNLDWTPMDDEQPRVGAKVLLCAPYFARPEVRIWDEHHANTNWTGLGVTWMLIPELPFLLPSWK